MGALDVWQWVYHSGNLPETCICFHDRFWGNLVRQIPCQAICLLNHTHSSAYSHENTFYRSRFVAMQLTDCYYSVVGLKSELRNPLDLCDRHIGMNRAQVWILPTRSLFSCICRVLGINKFIEIITSLSRENYIMPLKQIISFNKWFHSVCLQRELGLEGKYKSIVCVCKRYTCDLLMEVDKEYQRIQLLSDKARVLSTEIKLCK